MRLRTLLLMVLLIGLGGLQMAPARDPRVQPMKVNRGNLKPAQRYRTAKTSKKVKYKKFKAKKFKMKKFKQHKNRA